MKIESFEFVIICVKNILLVNTKLWEGRRKEEGSKMEARRKVDLRYIQVSRKILGSVYKGRLMVENWNRLTLNR